MGPSGRDHRTGVRSLPWRSPIQSAVGPNGKDQVDLSAEGFWRLWIRREWKWDGQDRTGDLLGEDSIADLCHRDLIARNRHFGRDREFLEADKKRFQGTWRVAIPREVDTPPCIHGGEENSEAHLNTLVREARVTVIAEVDPAICAGFIKRVRSDYAALPTRKDRSRTAPTFWPKP